MQVLPVLRRARVRAFILTIGLLVGALLSASSADATRGLTTGVFSFPSGSKPSQTETYLDRATSIGVSIVRVNVGWAGIAPTRPVDPTDPASAGYNWSSVDAQVRVLAAHGIKVLITVSDAPTWAEGANPPRDARPGTWRPNATDLGQFAQAIAQRYDGSYPDPLAAGSTLPRVSDFQVWNEPNLAYYLQPQWQRVKKHWQAVAPTVFRSLANAFYTGVKSVSSSDFVILGGTAPYGDPPGGPRIPPVEFYRYLFCLNGRVALKPTSCPSPVHANAVDNHPYGIGGPLQHALNPDDVSIPDIDKVTRVLRAAERAGHILPRGGKQTWTTEFSWDTKPPDPQGVPVQKQARWVEQALYVLWHQGVSTAMYYQLVDSPPIPNYASTYQAGFYYLSGKAKPSATAYRFPFVTSRANARALSAWGRAPQTGTVAIQVKRGRTWKTLHHIHVRSGQVFETRLSLRGKATLRAKLNGQTSLTWTQAG